MIKATRKCTYCNFVYCVFGWECLFFFLFCFGFNENILFWSSILIYGPRKREKRWYHNILTLVDFTCLCRFFSSSCLNKWVIDSWDIDQKKKTHGTHSWRRSWKWLRPHRHLQKSMDFCFAIVIDIVEREKANINIAHFVKQDEAFPKLVSDTANAKPKSNSNGSQINATKTSEPEVDDATHITFRFSHSWYKYTINACIPARLPLQFIKSVGHDSYACMDIGQCVDKLFEAKTNRV